MPVSVTLPALGESVTEGTVTRWLKQVGETVAADEPLLEVSTDKVDTEIPAPAAGVLLEIKVAEDETVEVGTELAVIGDEGEQPGAGGSDAGAGQAAGESEAAAGQQGQDGGGDRDDRARREERQPEQSVEPEPAAEGGYGRPDPADEAPATVVTSGEDGQAQQAQQAGQQNGGQGGQQGAASDGAGGGGARTPVLLPALGESVTEGTVTRWLKQVGEAVAVDEPLLEVSTDKVDTEIPAPVAGVLLEVKVGEDETVDVGTELAVIGAEGATGSDTGDRDSGDGRAPAAAPAASSDTGGAVGAAGGGAPEGPGGSEGAAAGASATDRPAQGDEEPPARPDAEPLAQEVQQHAAAETQSAERTQAVGGPAPAEVDDTAPAAAPFQGSAPSLGGTAPGAPASAPSGDGQAAGAQGGGVAGDGSAYVTPLVRRLAAEHNVDLSALTGTGVGGRIRKQDVLAAAEAAKTPPAPEPQPAPAAAAAAPPAAAKPAAAPQQPSPLRGTTQKMNRRRQTIARRMVESLQVSAQLTTVVEVDVTAVAQLRQRAKGDFERREGVKLSFLPFFAKASLEALKVYPQLNATIDTERNEVTYFDAEHLGVAVDTEAGLVVPVIREAGDLNIGGLARKIADVAERTRTNKITPDELSGGTFTLTNTGSRGALFDTPIINQPQVGILGTGAVVKRPVVVPDAYGADSIAVRSMVYLALTYDHRLVDGADAARFLGLVKQRLEEGAFEADLGL